MNKLLRLLFVTLACVYAGKVSAQLVGDNIFLQGHYLEIGSAKNGSLGSTRNAPAGYHSRSGGGGFYYDPATCTSASATTALCAVYDFGHDGWTAGTPTYMGDYALPGTPYEGWAIQVGTVTNYAYFTNYQSAAVGCNGFSAGGGGASTTTSGAFTTYTSSAGSVAGKWVGTTASGALSIVKDYRVDTESSSVVITVVLKNTTASPLSSVYYMRMMDADINETVSGGSFSTNNNVDYQNDYYHRVLATATSIGSASATGTPASKVSLGTKDCRAKCFVFTGWGSLSTSFSLANAYAGTASALGTQTFLGSNNGDYALGLVYNLGTIAAYDSTIISYAYIFDGTIGIDAAFPEPQMFVDGAAHDSTDTVTLCAGNTLPVNLLNANTRNWSWGKWTWSPTIGLASDTGVNNVIDGSLLTGTTVYTITGTDSAMGNCATKTFLLTVIPVTSPTPIVRDTVLCQGIVAPPLTATGTSLTWYTTATGGTGTSVAPVPATGVLGVYTWYVSQTVSGCTSPRVPITVTIVPPPVITLSNNGPLCPGNTLIITLTDTITSTTGITYSWNGPGGFTAVSQNVTIANVTTGNAGVYTVVVNNNGCATYPTMDTVVVNPTPIAPSFISPTYCQFVPAAALSATGSNIRWYTTATGGVGSTVAPTPSTMVAGLFTWYVTQTINGCESLRYPLTVTVNARPPAPIITNTPGDYCPGQTFNAYTVVLGSNILWYTGATGGVGSTTPPTVNTNVPGTYVNWASQTVLGCEGDRSSVTVTVFDRVQAQWDYTVRYGCHGDTVYFNNTSTGAINYQWDFGDGLSSIGVAPVHIYPNQGIYTVKLFAHSANCVDSSIITINLVHLDSAAFNIKYPIVCQGVADSFFNASVPSTGTVFWNFGDGTTSTITNPEHIYANTGLYNISVVVTDFVPCMDTAYGVVQVDSTGPITMTISDSVICKGSYVTLASEYTNIGSTQFVWNFGNGDSAIDVNPVMYAYTTTGIYNISASIHYRACPTKTTSTSIHVYDQPSISIGEDATICEGSTSLTLIDNINGTNAAATWLWNNGATTPSITVSTAGVYYVTVSLGGCTAADTVTITDDCQLAISNGFSPNGDGLNDYFNPRQFMGEGLKTFSMRIYNRWGQLIFETVTLDGRGWNGYYNGELQPEGVYVYTIDAAFIDGKKFNKSGNVTLLR